MHATGTKVVAKNSVVNKMAEVVLPKGTWPLLPAKAPVVPSGRSFSRHEIGTTTRLI